MALAVFYSGNLLPGACHVDEWVYDHLVSEQISREDPEEPWQRKKPMTIAQLTVRVAFFAGFVLAVVACGSAAHSAVSNTIAAAHLRGAQ